MCGSSVPMTAVSSIIVCVECYHDNCEYHYMCGLSVTMTAVSNIMCGVLP